MSDSTSIHGRSSDFVSDSHHPSSSDLEEVEQEEMVPRVSSELDFPKNIDQTTLPLVSQRAFSESAVFEVFTPLNSVQYLDADSYERKDVRRFPSSMGNLDIEKVRVDYSIPDTFILYRCGRDVRAHVMLGEEDYLICYADFLESGIRFPLRPFVVKNLVAYGVCFSQAHPNAIRQILAFESLCLRLGFQPSLPLFHYFFRFNWRGSYLWTFISSMPKKKLFADLPESVKEFETKYFIIRHKSFKALSFMRWMGKSFLPPKHDFGSVLPEEVDAIRSAIQKGYLPIDKLITNLVTGKLDATLDALMSDFGPAAEDVSQAVTMPSSIAEGGVSEPKKRKLAAPRMKKTEKKEVGAGKKARTLISLAPTIEQKQEIAKLAESQRRSKRIIERGGEDKNEEDVRQQSLSGETPVTVNNSPLKESGLSLVEIDPLGRDAGPGSSKLIPEMNDWCLGLENWLSERAPPSSTLRDINSASIVASHLKLPGDVDKGLTRFWPKLAGRYLSALPMIQSIDAIKDIMESEMEALRDSKNQVESENSKLKEEVEQVKEENLQLTSSLEETQEKLRQANRSLEDSQRENNLLRRGLEHEQRSLSIAKANLVEGQKECSRCLKAVTVGTRQYVEDRLELEPDFFKDLNPRAIVKEVLDVIAAERAAKKLSVIVNLADEVVEKNVAKN